MKLSISVCPLHFPRAEGGKPVIVEQGTRKHSRGKGGRRSGEARGNFLSFIMIYYFQWSHFEVWGKSSFWLILGWLQKSDFNTNTFLQTHAQTLSFSKALNGPGVDKKKKRMWVFAWHQNLARKKKNLIKNLIGVQGVLCPSFLHLC